MRSLGNIVEIDPPETTCAQFAIGVLADIRKVFDQNKNEDENDAGPHAFIHPHSTRLMLEVKFELVIEGQNCHGKADLALFWNYSKEVAFPLVVEVKTIGHKNDGIKQVVLYLLSTAQLGRKAGLEHKYYFGLCTDGVSWLVVRYHDAEELEMVCIIANVFGKIYFYSLQN